MEKTEGRYEPKLFCTRLIKWFFTPHFSLLAELKKGDYKTYTIIGSDFCKKTNQKLRPHDSHEAFSLAERVPFRRSRHAQKEQQHSLTEQGSRHKRTSQAIKIHQFVSIVKSEIEVLSNFLAKVLNKIQITRFLVPF